LRFVIHNNNKSSRQHLSKRCQEDFFKSGLTEEEVLEHYDIFLKVIMFTSKVSREERQEMRKTGLNMKEQYEQYIKESKYKSLHVRQLSSEEIRTKPRSKSNKAVEVEERPPLLKKKEIKILRRG